MRQGLKFDVYRVYANSDANNTDNFIYHRTIGGEPPTKPKKKSLTERVINRIVPKKPPTVDTKAYRNRYLRYMGSIPVIALLATVAVSYTILANRNLQTDCLKLERQLEAGRQLEHYHATREKGGPEKKPF